MKITITGKENKKKREFSKVLLFVDYLMMIVLFVCTFMFREVDLTAVDVAWIAQVGISSAAYYWKAKSDNRTKVPFMVIQSLPEEMRESIDLTQVICEIVRSDNN